MSVLLHMLIASTFRGVENMGLRGPFLGTKIGQTSHHWSFYQRFSTVFASFLVYMSNWATWRYVEYRPQRPNFRVILGSELDHNSGLQSFSQTISAAFTLFLFYVLIGGTFMCISMICPKCSISGPRVKVAVELVRPSGLLFCNTLGLHTKLISLIISQLQCELTNASGKIPELSFSCKITSHASWIFYHSNKLTGLFFRAHDT